MSVWKRLFGPSLQNNKGVNVSTEDALADREYVGIYFGAQWCGWSRKFVPPLISFYEKVASARKLEIVYVSADRNENSFSQFFGLMPWKSIPYNAQLHELKDQLEFKYGVMGYPTFVLLDKQGSIVLRDAREAVMRDSEGKTIPWKK